MTELIGQLSGVDVVGSAPNVERGLQLVDELEPDVLTVDVRLPGRSGRPGKTRKGARDHPGNGRQVQPRLCD